MGGSGGEAEDGEAAASARPAGGGEQARDEPRVYARKKMGTGNSVLFFEI